MEHDGTGVGQRDGEVSHDPGSTSTDIHFLNGGRFTGTGLSPEDEEPTMETGSGPISHGYRDLGHHPKVAAVCRFEDIGSQVYPIVPADQVRTISQSDFSQIGTRRRQPPSDLSTGTGCKRLNRGYALSLSTTEHHDATVKHGAGGIMPGVWQGAEKRGGAICRVDTEHAGGGLPTCPQTTGDEKGASLRQNDGTAERSLKLPRGKYR